MLELLRSTKASVVGMPWRIQPGAQSRTARAIALAVSHPLGTGGVKYRQVQHKTKLVDTVPFGAFAKALWQKMNGFDETLLTNEDYDFNYRVRKDGGHILLDNVAYSDYYARPKFVDLARQYARYGLWKARMIRLHPFSIRPRHLALPSTLLALLGIAVAGFCIPGPGG